MGKTPIRGVWSVDGLLLCCLWPLILLKYKAFHEFVGLG